jgi:hypothetical protein
MESERIKAFSIGKVYEKPGVSSSLRHKGNVEALQEGATDKHCSCSLASSFYSGTHRQ